MNQDSTGKNAPPSKNPATLEMTAEEQRLAKEHAMQQQFADIAVKERVKAERRRRGGKK